MKKLIIVSLLIILTGCVQVQTTCEKLLSQKRELVNDYNYRIAIKNPVDSTIVYREIAKTDSMILKYCKCDETK